MSQQRYKLTPTKQELWTRRLEYCKHYILGDLDAIMRNRGIDLGQIFTSDCFLPHVRLPDDVAFAVCIAESVKRELQSYGWEKVDVRVNNGKRLWWFYGSYEAKFTICLTRPCVES